MRFTDPTFVDMLLRRRANYKIANPDNKTRLCYLLAQEITRGHDSALRRVLALQRWVGQTIPHVINHDIRGVSDMYRLHALDVIARGWAACEATAEVFATLCWLAGYPARVLSIQRSMSEPVTGHHVNEVFIDGGWRFMDADLYRCFKQRDGQLASALDIQRDPDLASTAEARRQPEQFPADLPGARRQYQDESGQPNYHRFFEVIRVQEGLFSLDGFYGQWLACTPETQAYLYGPPQHPDSQRLLQGPLPFVYVRDATKIEDHFGHVWDVDWQSWSR